MNKIVFKLNPDDSFKINDSAFDINLSSKEDYHHTFYRSMRLLYKMPTFFQNEALDLFYISLMIYFADRKVSRIKSYDCWTRNFKLYIPVLELKKWNDNKKLLQEMISYLSGDIWEFEFRKRELNDLETKISKKIATSFLKMKFETDAFCMLSGGLDSFVGAIDLLSKNKNIAFVGLYGGGKGVKPFQDNINSLLKDKFKLSDNNFFNFNATPVKGIEDSTRTRSFLFFSHAIILASCFNKQVTLYIPENGLISLNIPLTNTRLGSSSTRTTHPYYMKLLQELLNSLGLKIELKNPYQFLTKGEMLDQCLDRDFTIKNYSLTMSCSHPDHGRYKKETKPLHCGTCLPCTIRRASIKTAFDEDKTEYRDANYKERKAQVELRSFKVGILDFNKNSDNPFAIQISGKIDENLSDYENLYKRGMLELGGFLDLQNE